MLEQINDKLPHGRPSQVVKVKLERCQIERLIEDPVSGREWIRRLAKCRYVSRRDRDLIVSMSSEELLRFLRWYVKGREALKTVVAKMLVKAPFLVDFVDRKCSFINFQSKCAAMAIPIKLYYKREGYIIVVKIKRMPRNGRELQECQYIVAHEIAHAFLHHGQSLGEDERQCDRDADQLAEKWGFPAPQPEVENQVS